MLVQSYLGVGSIIIITITPLQQYDNVIVRNVSWCWFNRILVLVQSLSSTYLGVGSIASWCWFSYYHHYHTLTTIRHCYCKERILVLVQSYLGAGSIIIIAITPLQQYDTVTQNEHAIIQTSKAKQTKKVVLLFMYTKNISVKKNTNVILVKTWERERKKELLCHLTLCAYNLNANLIHDAFILNAAAHYLNRY